MAQTQISEKLGASGSVFQSDIGYNPQVSAFDLSKKVATTLSEGYVVPLDVVRLLPGDKMDFNLRYLLDVLPQVVPPHTNYKLITQLWRTSLLDLWKGAETFVTKGRNASIDLSIPTCSYSDLYSDDKTSVDSGSAGYYVSTPHGLPTMLGLPPVRYSLADENVEHTPSYLAYVAKYDDSNTTSPVTHYNAIDEVNALIPFFYQKICRTMMPTNLLQDCKVWFPDDISNDDWRIDTDGSNLSADGHFVPIGTTMPDGVSTPFIANFVPHAGNDESRDNSVNIWQMRSPQYPDDLFTTSKPWLVRGDETEVDLDVTNMSLGLYSLQDVDADAERYAVFDGKCSVGGWDTLSDSDKKWYRSITGLPMRYTPHGDADPSKYRAFYNFLMPSSAALNGNAESMRHPHTVAMNNGTKASMYFNDSAGSGTVAVSANGTALGSVSKEKIDALGDMRNGISFGNTYVTLRATDVADNLGIQVIGQPRVAFTANTIRTLLAFSIKDEIDALTNGNYNSTIKAHFGVMPKHHDFEPQYVGGTVDYLQFGEVMQTSASTDSQPLGTKAGTGGTSAGGYLGHIESDDFGYAMVVAYVVPEVTYTDGVDKMWTDIAQSDLWFPEWSQLGFQPVLNKEIKITGVESTDNDLFGYQTRGIEYKQRRNSVAGLFQLFPEEDAMFSAYTQARLFDDVPELSNEFTTASPNNLRRDYLAFPELPSYRLQCALDVRAVRPLPYKSVPARFGM